MEENININTILNPIHSKMELVEELLLKNLESNIFLLNQLGQYILKSGGKRIRPALLIFSAALKDYHDNDTCLAANVIEYIHTATLLHDDVVDHANLRRSKKSARSIWGNEASVLVGDYLFTISFQFLADFGNIEVIQALSKATTMMARGEILQLIRSYDSATEKDYLDIVLHKTASLMSVAMEIGGILGNATDQEKSALKECGKCIGIAFQMVDDALDYSLKDNLGKPHGTDLKERKITLPLSHLLQTCSPEDKKQVQTILNQKEITNEHVVIVGELVQKYHAKEYTLKQAEKYVKKAIDSLNCFQNNIYKQSIIQLAKYIIYRKK